MALALLLAPSIYAQSDGAYSVISDLASAPRRTFYAYQDADSGLSKGFLTGIFGPADKVQIDAGCIDDPTNRTTGCATSRAQLDCVRGTVLRVSWSPLASTESAGFNIEDPQNYTRGDRGAGYDLTGVTELVFDYRSPTGIRVKFGLGSAETDFYTIPASTDWKELRIDLTKLKSPPPLREVHILFRVVTDGNNWNTAGTLLLDNIRLEPAPSRQDAAPGLPRSYKTCGVIPAREPLTGRVRVPPDQVNRNPAAIADASLAVQALLRRATVEDLRNARAIADGLVYALNHENNGAPLPRPADNSPGWHSAYVEDVALNNNQLAPSTARAGDSRLAGFSSGRNVCGTSGFCLVLDGATGGNNAQAILALVAAWRQFRTASYLDAARRAANWIHGLLFDDDLNSYGGYFQGVTDGGGFRTRFKSKRTVDNALIAAAFEQLAQVETLLGNSDAAARWSQRSDNAGSFVVKMVNQNTGGLFAGTVALNTSPGNGVCNVQQPRSGDIINTCEFTENVTVSALALTAHPRFRSGVEWRRALQSAVDRFSYTARAGGDEYRGMNLADHTDGPFGIALEYTGQMAAAMKAVDGVTGETRFKAAAEAFLASMRQAQTSAPFTDGHGIVAAILSDADRTAPDEQCLTTPFACIPTRVGLAATAWAIFAERGFNPFGPLPVAQASSVLNAFGFDKVPAATVAPNTAFSLFGSFLSFDTAQATALVNGALPKVLAGTGVAVSGVCAPLYYVSPTQINGLMPQVSPGNPQRVDVRVYRSVPGSDCLQGTATAATEVKLSEASPAILAGGTGTGRAIAYHGTDSTLVTEGSPGARGEIVTLFGTGLGAVSGALEIGRPAATVAAVTGVVEVSIGGVDLPRDHICYAGLTPGTAGLYQLNVRIPAEVQPATEAPVVVRVGGVAAQSGLTIPVGGATIDQRCF